MAEIVATTERLRLRTWDDEDGLRFFRIMNTPAVMRWLGGVQSPDGWHAAFDRLRAYERDFGFTFWIAERKSDDEILGFCGLKRANAPGADAIAGEVEIGWRLREDAWGKGYAKEAAIASLDLAFDRFDAPRVVAVTAAGNVPSQGLMKRLGMERREDLDFVDQRFPPDSDVNPQVVFMIDASGWPDARAAALA
ncbi:MAG TPA: GNAT family N-acetyltransferase [Sphingomicrobium sp.]|nr:GNAT family N-acetyltransferase [Sphingomicrobium sp.]